MGEKSFAAVVLLIFHSFFHKQNIRERTMQEGLHTSTGILQVHSHSSNSLITRFDYNHNLNFNKPTKNEYKKRIQRQRETPSFHRTTAQTSRAGTLQGVAKAPTERVIDLGAITIDSFLSTLGGGGGIAVISLTS